LRATRAIQSSGQRRVFNSVRNPKQRPEAATERTKKLLEFEAVPQKDK
jgi:hypothetical protein